MTLTSMMIHKASMMNDGDKDDGGGGDRSAEEKRVKGSLFATFFAKAMATEVVNVTLSSSSARKSGAMAA